MIFPYSRMVATSETASPVPENGIRVHHVIATRVLLALIPVQMLLPFLGLPIVFHWLSGSLLGVGAGYTVHLALRAHLSRDLVRLNVLLASLFVLQLGLYFLGRWQPGVAGLHGVNAVIIFGVALVLAVEVGEEKPQSA